MSATPTIYRSTDVGAPVLSGTPGAFAALLDAVLVNGYGEKSPLGWLRPFSSGHKRVYRNDTAKGATGFYIRFNDAGTRECGVLAYETMADVDTGTHAFNGAESLWMKSSTQDAVSRDWTIIGTSRCCYFFVDCGGDAYSNLTGWFFGDLVTFGTYDVWAFAYSDNTSPYSFYRISGLLGSQPAHAGLHAARTHDGNVVGAALKPRNMPLSGQAFFGSHPNFGFPYPYPINGGFVLSNIIIMEGALMRAMLPGLWVAEHDNVIDHGEVYTDFPGFPAGTEMLCMRAQAERSSIRLPRALWDLTNPWH